MKEWINRNPQAWLELQELLNIKSITHSFDDESNESTVQYKVRLEAAKKGIKLFRNNVGVLVNNKGVPVRFGLANDSQKLNAQFKSADLIGWEKILITPDMIGSNIARFVSRETKHKNWKYTGTAREIAQIKWALLILADGGDACFSTGDDTL